MQILLREEWEGKRKSNFFSPFPQHPSVDTDSFDGGHPRIFTVEIKLSQTPKKAKDERESQWDKETGDEDIHKKWQRNAVSEAN